jgi:hypothetical protein
MVRHRSESEVRRKTWAKLPQKQREKLPSTLRTSSTEGMTEEEDSTTGSEMQNVRIGALIVGRQGVEVVMPVVPLQAQVVKTL